MDGRGIVNSMGQLKLQPLSLESLDLCLPASEDNASTKMPKDAVATRKTLFQHWHWA